MTLVLLHPSGCFLLYPFGLFFGHLFRRMRSRQPSGSFDPCSTPRSPLWNTRRRSKVADLLSSHTLTGSGWANPLFTGQFQKKLIVTGRALYFICGHSSLKNLLCTVCYSPLCSVSKLLRLARPQLRVSAVRVRTCIRKR